MRRIALLSCVALLLAGGCGKTPPPATGHAHDSAPAADTPAENPAAPPPVAAQTPAPPPAATTPAPAAPTAPAKLAPGEVRVELDGGVQVVRLTGNDAMKYNGRQFTVRAGQPVRLELKNIGTLAPDLMAHNVVVLKAGADAEAYNFAAVLAKAEAYVPAAQMDQVVAHTALAGRGQTVSVEFTAPAPGACPFICTFPGHFVAGMRGTMNVVP